MSETAGSLPAERSGYRGYIASRLVRGSRTPQHVQNLVIRDYAARHRLRYLLSATEYAMPACYLMLDNLLAELPRLEGMIAYSLFMLPARPERRAAVYRRFLACGAVLHCAVEGLQVGTAADAARTEDILRVQTLLDADTGRMPA